MLEKLLDEIMCPSCEKGKMVYSNATTLAAYSDVDFFDIENMDKILDSVTHQYITLTCLSCGYSDRYTLSDIEAIVRSTLMNKVISLYASKQLMSRFMPDKESVLVYCGDCRGFDGRGSCPIGFYETCGIRKLL